MKTTYRWNPRTKRLEEVTDQHQDRPRRFSGAITHDGRQLTTREEFRNYVRSTPNLVHPSEVPAMQRDVARAREHRTKQDRAGRKAALVKAMKGYGL